VEFLSLIFVQDETRYVVTPCFRGVTDPSHKCGKMSQSRKQHTPELVQRKHWMTTSALLGLDVALSYLSAAGYPFLV